MWCWVVRGTKPSLSYHCYLSDASIVWLWSLTYKLLGGNLLSYLSDVWSELYVNRTYPCQFILIWYSGSDGLIRLSRVMGSISTHCKYLNPNLSDSCDTYRYLLRSPPYLRRLYRLSNSIERTLLFVVTFIQLIKKWVSHRNQSVVMSSQLVRSPDGAKFIRM